MNRPFSKKKERVNSLNLAVILSYKKKTGAHGVTFNSQNGTNWSDKLIQDELKPAFIFNCPALRQCSLQQASSGRLSAKNFNQTQ